MRLQTSGVWDVLVVSALLLASIVYALLKLGPQPLQRRLLTLGGAVLRHTRLAMFHRWASRLDARAAAKTGGCGAGCDSCGPGEPPGNTEVRISPRQIGRR